MKKAAVYFILFVLLSYLGTNIYWMVREQGNVNIYANNLSNWSDLPVVILFDNDTVVNRSFKNNLYDISKKSLFTSPGEHEVEVIVTDKNLSAKEIFTVVGPKWIRIEISDGRFDPRNPIAISVESRPLVFE